MRSLSYQLSQRSDVYDGLRLRTDDERCDIGDRTFDDGVYVGDRSCLLTKALS
ncbi:hypothetical protein ACWATR_25110 [Nostoc sp. UIC 10890]